MAGLEPATHRKQEGSIGAQRRAPDGWAARGRHL